MTPAAKQGECRQAQTGTAQMATAIILCHRRGTSLPKGGRGHTWWWNYLTWD